MNLRFANKYTSPTQLTCSKPDPNKVSPETAEFFSKLEMVALPKSYKLFVWGWLGCGAMRCDAGGHWCGGRHRPLQDPPVTWTI